MQDNYADFATLYDTATTTDNETKVALFKSLIGKYHPDSYDLLELGCGTGNILEAFVRDYNVTGLDLSAAMLRQAAAKVPDARLVQADMSAFSLHQKFDVILCVFDTINHLLDFHLWDRLFAHVAHHLQAGGLFIFDVNTFSKLRRRANEQPVFQQVGGLTEVRASMEHEKASIFAWHISIRAQQPDGSFKRHTVKVPEAVFPIRAIEAAAGKYFSVAEKLTDDDTPVSESADRIYFVCRPR